MVRRGEPLSRIERGRPGGGLLIGGSRVPRACRAATDPADGIVGCSLFRSFDLGDRPAESGELAGRGDGDDRPSLPTGLEARPGAVQPLLRRPRDRDSFLGLTVLPFGQAFAEVRSRAVMPCCLSPVSASSTAATIFVACTSKPTQDLAFAMAGSSNM